MAQNEAVPNGTLQHEKVVPNGTTADSRLTSESTPADSSASSFRSTASQLQPVDTPASSAKTTETIAGADKVEEEEEDWQIPTEKPLKTPITRPVKAATPQPPPQLSPEQETKYATVLASVSSWQTLPATTARTAPQAPIQDHERMWLTRECLLRYLRATKWQTPAALRRLQSTLSWRREYGADTFTADYISPENESGKQLILGYDNDARPCLYLNPAKQNTKVSDRQIHHLCYMLDRTIDMMPPGQESACLLISFKNSASGNVPSVNQARAVLNILQNHSPERLGKALISDSPWYVGTFFKLISGFIDPVTKEKMKFNEPQKNYVPEQQLWRDNGGLLEFDYEHQKYWPALDEECKRRRRAYRERWERAGKRIGEFEEFLRGGKGGSLQDVLDRAAREEGVKVAEGEPDADLAAAGVGRLSVQ